MPTTNIDPQTGTNYAAGAWTTAGLGNLVSQRVAVTATTFAANPGTGLTKLNSSDAQWLQTTGRLQNGDVSRDSGESHRERFGEVGDAGVAGSEGDQKRSPGRVGQGREGPVDMFNHFVEHSRAPA